VDWGLWAGTHRQGLIFFSNISSSSAGVRLDVSGMTKNEATHSGKEIPAKKKHVLRPLQYARVSNAFDCSTQYGYCSDVVVIPHQLA
jgi:hypothetical protein